MSGRPAADRPTERGEAEAAADRPAEPRRAKRAPPPPGRAEASEASPAGRPPTADRAERGEAEAAADRPAARPPSAPFALGFVGSQVPESDSEGFSFSPELRWELSVRIDGKSGQ